MMIGRDENVEYMGGLDISGEVALEARNIGKAGMFENISLKAYKGGDTSSYGLVGAGRTELARLLVGADRMDTGEIYIGGKRAASTPWRTRCTSTSSATSARTARKRG